MQPLLRLAEAIKQLLLLFLPFRWSTITCFDIAKKVAPILLQERLERTNKLQPKLRKEKDVQPSAASGSTKEKDSKRRMSVSKLGNGHSFAASNRSPHGRTPGLVSYCRE